MATQCHVPVSCNNRPVQYREWAPIPALAGAVDCVWTLDGHARPGDEPQPVLPDGRPELVIHFGDPFAMVANGDHRRQPALVFAGQLSSQLLLQPGGRIAIVGIRFRPHGAASVLRMPQDRLMGVPMPLDDVDPALRKALGSIRGDADDLTGAALHAQRALARFVRVDRIDARVACAVDVISRARGQVSIDRVAAHAGMTRRHLERRFLDQVGLTPKRLARIARFQHALQLLETEHPGAHAAAESGYADQAHFVRDFRELAGCAPSEHLLTRAEITRVFIASSAPRSAHAPRPPR